MMRTLSEAENDWRYGSVGRSMGRRNFSHRDQAIDCLVDVPRVVDDFLAVAAAMQRARIQFLALEEQCESAGNAERGDENEGAMSASLCQGESHEIMSLQ